MNKSEFPQKEGWYWMRAISNFEVRVAKLSEREQKTKVSIVRVKKNS